MVSNNMDDKELELTEFETRLPSIDPKRERRVVWKLDLFIAPVIMMLQLISYLDRSNIGFAATQGLASDIHLHGSQFNVRIQTHMNSRHTYYGLGCSFYILCFLYLG